MKPSQNSQKSDIIIIIIIPILEMKKDFELRNLQENTVGLDLRVWYCHVEDAIYSVFLLDSCKAKMRLCS